MTCCAAGAQECDTENGWNLFNGVCFRVSRSAGETQYTWQEAQAACLAEGGNVATLTSTEEQDFVIDLVSNDGARWPTTALMVWARH